MSNKLIKNRFDLNFEKFYQFLKNGELKRPYDIIHDINLSKTHKNHIEDIDVQKFNEDELSPLHYAVLFNNKDIIEHLLSLNVDINSQTFRILPPKNMNQLLPKRYKNETCLHIASKEGNFEVVELFLTQPDINLNIRNFDGKTALEVSKEGDVEGLFKKYISSEIRETSTRSLEERKSSKLLLQKELKEFQSILSKSSSKLSTSSTPKDLLEISKKLEFMKKNITKNIENLQNPFSRSVQKANKKEDNSVNYIINVTTNDINIFNSANADWIGSHELPKDLIDKCDPTKKESIFTQLDPQKIQKLVSEISETNEDIRRNKREIEIENSKIKKERILKKRFIPKTRRKELRIPKVLKNEIKISEIYKQEKADLLSGPPKEFKRKRNIKFQKFKSRTFKEEIGKKKEEDLIFEEFVDNSDDEGDEDDDEEIEKKKKKISNEPKLSGDLNNEANEENNNNNNNFKIINKNCMNCQISDQEIAIGCNNGNIFLKNFYFPKTNQILRTNNSPITTICSNYDFALRNKNNNNNNLILSGSLNSDIHLFRNKKHQVLFDDTFSSEINDLKLFSTNDFLSCSSDGYLKLINFEQQKTIYSFNSENYEPITTFDFFENNNNNNVFYFGGVDKIIRFGDIRTSNKNYIFKKFKNSIVSSIIVVEDKIISSNQFGVLNCFDIRKINSGNSDSSNSIIKLWKNERLTVINNKPKLKLNKLIKIKNNNEFFMFNYKNNLKFIDFSTGNLKHEIYERNNGFGYFSFRVNNNNKEEEENKKNKKVFHQMNTKENRNLEVNNLKKLKKIHFQNRFSNIFMKKKAEDEDLKKRLIKNIKNDINKNNKKIIIDGKIHRIIIILKKLKEEKENLSDLRTQFMKDRNELRKDLNLQIEKQLRILMKPTLQKLEDEKNNFKKLRKDVGLFFRSEIKYTKNKFRNKFSFIFKRVLEKEKREFEILKSQFLERNERFNEIQYFEKIKKVYSDLKFTLKQKNNTISKFKKIEDLRLKYDNSEFSKLQERVKKVQEKINEFHGKLVSGYQDLNDLYEKFENEFIFSYFSDDNNSNNNNNEEKKRKELNVKWNFSDVTEKTISFIENFQGQKELIYLGEIVSNKANGKGVVFIRRKRIGFGKKIKFGKYLQMVYDGEFLNNKKDGKGIEFKDEKIIYEGLFKNNEREGRGIEYNFVKKKCIQGTWRKGTLTTSPRSNRGESATSSMFSSSSSKNKKKSKKEYGEVVEFSFEIIHYEEIEDQLIEENELGKGAYGTVYSIKYDGKECAAKIMDMKYVDHFTREKIRSFVRRSLRLISNFDHPSIIKIFGMISGKHDKIGYVMQKCSHCVGNEIFEKNLNFKDKLLIMYDTARGMEYLHSKNVMMRDLKWDNVLIKSKFRKEVVITDFDTAKEDESIWKNSVQNTATSIGTPVFVAPEVLSKKYGLKVDVYSFGVMIHSLLFNLMNPYSETERCMCGQDVKNITPYSFPFHTKTCGLRPFISDKRKREIKDHLWLIELMKDCYSSNPLQRPSFTEIVSLMEKRMNNMVEKRVRIVVKGLENENSETYIMLDSSYQSVKSKIEYRWKKYEILNLYHIPLKLYQNKYERLSQSYVKVMSNNNNNNKSQTENKNKKKSRRKGRKKKNNNNPIKSISNINRMKIKLPKTEDLMKLEDNDDFYKIMNKYSLTTILVEFTVQPVSEKGELRKELQEIVEKNITLKTEDEKTQNDKINKMNEKVEELIERKEREIGAHEDIITEINFKSFQISHRRKYWDSENYEDEDVFSEKEKFSFFARFRPLNNREKEIDKKPVRSGERNRSDDFVVKIVEDKNVHLYWKRMKNDEDKRFNSFTYDKVFDDEVTQEKIFNETCRSKVESLFEGKNSTVILYGQSGSGKSFSLHGTSDPELEGLYPRTLDFIFSKIQKINNKDIEYRVLISYFEIYNWEIRDIINFKKNKKKKTRMKDLLQVGAKSKEFGIGIIQKSNERRNHLLGMNGMSMNSRSSRSYSFIKIELFSKDFSINNNNNNNTRKSNILFVKAPGSERISSTGAMGGQLKEAQFINGSLMKLSHCIGVAVDGRKEFMYKSSIINKILREYISVDNLKNSVTVLVHATKHLFNLEETVKSLDYFDFRSKRAVIEEQQEELMRLLKVEKNLERVRRKNEREKNLLRILENGNNNNNNSEPRSTRNSILQKLEQRKRVRSSVFIDNNNNNNNNLETTIPGSPQPNINNIRSRSMFDDNNNFRPTSGFRGRGGFGGMMRGSGRMGMRGSSSFSQRGRGGGLGRGRIKMGNLRPMGGSRSGGLGGGNKKKK